MNELFNEIDNCIKEYEKSMQKTLKLLEQKTLIIEELKNDIKKIEELK